MQQRHMAYRHQHATICSLYERTAAVVPLFRYALKLHSMTRIKGGEIKYIDYYDMELAPERMWKRENGTSLQITKW